MQDVLVVRASFGDALGTMGTSMACSIAGGSAGSLTIPTWVWNQTPRYPGGFGYISVEGWSLFNHLTTSVPGLDYGLGVNFLTSHSVQVALGK